jgi:hypothetical protein
VAAAQRAQTQAWRCAAAGTRASSVGVKTACRHQQSLAAAGGAAGPVGAAIAQPLGPPHSGQRLGSGAVVAGCMRVVFCAMNGRAARGPASQRTQEISP